MTLPWFCKYKEVDPSEVFITLCMHWELPIWALCYVRWGEHAHTEPSDRRWGVCVCARVCARTRVCVSNQPVSQTGRCVGPTAPRRWGRRCAAAQHQSTEQMGLVGSSGSFAGRHSALMCAASRPSHLQWSGGGSMGKDRGVEVCEVAAGTFRALGNNNVASKTT